jgi:GNAT superfamily N-acetyltransferase
MPHRQRQIGVANFRDEVAGELIFGSLIGYQLCGYISIWQPNWFVHHLYVDPPAQGQGIGRALLAYAQTMAGNNSLSLKCQKLNTRALEFYTAAGFVDSHESGDDEYGGWVRLVRQPDV